MGGGSDQPSANLLLTTDKSDLTATVMSSTSNSHHQEGSSDTTRPRNEATQTSSRDIPKTLDDTTKDHPMALASYGLTKYTSLTPELFRIPDDRKDARSTKLPFKYDAIRALLRSEGPYYSSYPPLVNRGVDGEMTSKQDGTFKVEMLKPLASWNNECVLSSSE